MVLWDDIMNGFDLRVWVSKQRKWQTEFLKAHVLHERLLKGVAPSTSWNCSEFYGFVAQECCFY